MADANVSIVSSNVSWLTQSIPVIDLLNKLSYSVRRLPQVVGILSVAGWKLAHQI
jgi:hypothetical protein